jgi:hypothetical protein
MSGHVLHLCNLYCHCLSKPLPSLSFSVHISHSITRFPDPSLTSLLESLKGCAHFGTFAALTQDLSAFHFSGCPSGGTVGNTSLCTCQRAQQHSNLTFCIFYCMSTRAASDNSSRAHTENRSNSVPKLYSLDLVAFWVALLFSHPQRCWHHVIAILS